MIPPNDDGRPHLAGGDKPVEGKTGPVPLAITEPQDPGREALKRDPLLCQIQPAMQGPVFGKQPSHRVVRDLNIGRVSRERCPSERPHAFAKQIP